MNCTVIGYQKTGGARHPLGPMDATPMVTPLIWTSKYFVLIAEFINLYYIDELIPSSKKFCSIYSPHQ